jgi:hypothetical protein
MLGYTPKYATGVWVGQHENGSANNLNMEYMTGPIWGSFMQKAHEGQGEIAKWAKPEGVKTVSHDSAFFSLVKGSCKNVALGNICGYGQSDIYPSAYTARKSTNTQQKVVIDTVSGKRATDCTPAAARKEITGGGIIIPEVEKGDPNYNNFMAPITARLKAGTGEAVPAEDQIDDVHSCSDVKPSVTISIPASCNGSCTISASVTAGTKGLTNLYFKMDGTTLSGGAMDISSGGNYSMTYIPDTGGTHEFTAQVVDSALYDNTSAPVSSTLTSVPFNVDSATPVGANIKITWDDITGSYSLISSGSNNGSALGCTPLGSKCTALVSKASFGGSGTYSVSIKSTTTGRVTANSVSFTD